MLKLINELETSICEILKQRNELLMFIESIRDHIAGEDIIITDNTDTALDESIGSMIFQDATKLIKRIESC